MRLTEEGRGKGAEAGVEGAMLLLLKKRRSPMALLQKYALNFVLILLSLRGRRERRFPLSLTTSTSLILL